MGSEITATSNHDQSQSMLKVSENKNVYALMMRIFVLKIFG